MAKYANRIDYQLEYIEYQLVKDFHMLALVQ